MKVTFELDAKKEAGAIQLMQKCNNYYCLYKDIVRLAKDLREQKTPDTFTYSELADHLDELIRFNDAEEIYFPEDN